MSMFVALLLASSSASGATTATQPTTTAAAVAPATAKSAKEKRICKTADSDPGSHMIKRSCKTQAEWDAQGMFGTSRSGFSISGDKMEGH